MIRLGINGFGRTGRTVARIALERNDVNLVAINSRADAESHAYLLQYDSVHGIFPHSVEQEGSHLVVDGKQIHCLQYDDPAQIPWSEVQAEIVIEASGKFRKRAEAAKHLGNTVKKVVISAPSTNADKTLVLGVNEQEYDPARHHIISNASCTTNCMAVICKVVNEKSRIKRGIGITVHAPTQSQSLLDRSNAKDKRRGRAAFLNIIPTTTGFAQAVGEVLPELAGKLASFAIRVPVGDGSLAILNLETERKLSRYELEQTVQAYAEKRPEILTIGSSELVSQDIVGNTASAIYDPAFTKIVGKNMLSIFAWYDNEMGYSARLLDLVAYIGAHL